MTLEEKIKLIDSITERHPHYGVDKGWSWYVGGMKDDGAWYFRKMLDVPAEELQAFLDGIIAEENKPPIVYTEQELADMKIVHKMPNGGWMTEYGKKQLEEYCKQRDRKIFFGLDDKI
jgi:hypothetical protein